jgi:hypothetical protein
VREHPEARPIRSELMDTAIVAKEVRAGDPFEKAGRESHRTREERALELHQKYSDFFVRIGPSDWYILSQDSGKRYRVHYPAETAEEESCSCRDFQYRGSNTGRPCVHILACAIHCAKSRCTV